MPVDEATGEKAFATWLTRRPQGIAGLFVALSYVLLVAAKYIPDLSHLTPHELASAYQAHKAFYDSIPSLFQCFALLPPLWWCLRARPPVWTRDGIANTACVQFRWCLSALVASWILFYLLNFLAQNSTAQGLGLWIDLSNNMQSLFLFAAYWTLTAITVPDEEPNKRIATFPLSRLVNYGLWALMAFFIADLIVKASGARFWFQLTSGLSVGICMALVVGCLESEYLNSPRALTACLYCYAVLQLAYVGFNFPPDASCSNSQALIAERTLQLFATLTSLPLKLLFISLCYWHLQTGRLAFYMEKARVLIIKDAPEQWEEFSSRRTGKS
jgi:hypothetical protein